MRIPTAATVRAPKQRQSRRGANPSVPLGFFKISLGTFFQNNPPFFQKHNGTADSRTRAETVPERGKSFRALTILKNFDDVLAAQVPPGSILTSVACGPDCPRPKDFPGLGDPNTFKLRAEVIIF